ncbi:hypothetical protein [Helicobacter marmotae]|uniref:hypothetical protein n=1 Tax=Helicobacter marmotae TaxID=152490 RepID=UPI0011C01F00|nr:hypothetical protein [Helicobacter marmotae]
MSSLERSEVLLWATSDSGRDSSGIRPQHDKLCALIGNRLNILQRKLLCHSKHCKETSPELPASPLFCHSEPLQGVKNLSHLLETP